MKAVLLTAGVGSRIRPLTDDKPKSLLSIGNKTILGRMVDAIIAVGIKEIVVVTGYRFQQIKEFLQSNYPDQLFHFIYNDHYQETNTGYSLLLTQEYVKGDDFIKFDADVVFEKAILEKLITSPYSSALCIDRNINLEAEEVKVIIDHNQQVLRVGKTLNPQKANGESIGIEKIDKDAAKVLFKELALLMQKQENWQEYYDDIYTTLVAKGIPMFALDITGLLWIEIDTHADFARAQILFSS